MARRCLLYLVALQLTGLVETGGERRELSCVYEMCVTRRREARMLIGCLVTCRSDRELIFSGTCSDWFGIFSWWYVKNVRSSSYRELKAVKIGLAYYFSGYLIRPLSSRMMGSLNWDKSNASHLSGSAVCWKRGEKSGGSLRLNITDTKRYVLSVDDEGANATWKVNGEGSDGIDDILMTNLSLDVGVLRHCDDIVNAAIVGHSSSNRRSLSMRTSVIRTEPCSGANIYLNWSAVWANWTKYGEFEEFCQRDTAFHLSVNVPDGGSRLVSMTGMFIVSAGAFSLLALLCCMSVKQRRSILKDFQGRSSLRSAGGGVAEPMTGSLTGLRRVSL